eukprot:TRINITY_DN1332_c0_g1_i1.p1 TRINITY_DN1332_c0_g1~~TRINITY_DN1332_c0_g1_i1.p1  ORF type:complete len:963 (-),score=160.13 TRINITY_DN1332_c0_g1_i1:5578-8466(-)
MDKYFEIVKAISTELNEIISDPEIDCSVAFLYSKIKRIKDEKMRNRLINQVKYLIQKAENKAFDRSFAFPTLKSIMESIATSIPEASDKLCQEQGIPEFRFFEPSESTAEEIQKREEERKAYATDFYKKAKKKPKTEEEEKTIWEEVKKGILVNLKDVWFNKLDGVDKELEKKQLDYKMLHHEMMDYSKYEALSRKKSILDETIQENVILLRLDLDAELTPIKYEEVETGLEKSKEMEEPAAEEKKTIKKLVERKVVDLRRLNDAKNTIQYLVERMADRILIVGSLGSPLGYNAPEYSLEPISKAFKSVFDQEIGFKEQCEFENFAQMLEDNEIPEGGTVLLENLNFNPSEYGFSFNPATGQVKLTSTKQQELYRERLGTYGRIYVNDAPEASLTECASICGIKSEHMLLGLRMKEMINKLAAFFMYSGYPFAAVLGGNDIIDKILLINSLIDTATHIYLFGPLAMYFMSALGMKLYGFEHDNAYYAAVHKVMAKAKENAVEIVLPKDFVVIKALPKKEPVVEEKKEPEHKQEEVKGKKEAAKGAKKGKVEEKKVEEKKEEEVKRDEKAELAARLEEERVWINEALANSQQKKVKIPVEDIYAWFLNKEKSDPLPDFVSPDEWIIGYGDETSAEIKKATEKPLRVFWDGELDLKERDDTKYLTRAMYDSLLKRKAEIPVHRKKRKLTLIHGAGARDAMANISEVVKLEEKERLRKERLAAFSEDDEPEPEEPLEEEEKKGFDVSTVCTDCLADSPFTMKLMQGDYIPGLLNIEERPRPTRDELECDLSILEDIQLFTDLLLQYLIIAVGMMHKKYVLNIKIYYIVIVIILQQETQLTLQQEKAEKNRHKNYQFIKRSFQWEIARNHSSTILLLQLSRLLHGRQTKADLQTTLQRICAQPSIKFQVHPEFCAMAQDYHLEPQEVIKEISQKTLWQVQYIGRRNTGYTSRVVQKVFQTSLCGSY